MKSLTIVIPNREGETPELTIRSLYGQVFKDFDIIIVNDANQNANAARNAGFSLVKTKYVLFSDNDINWHPEALRWMFEALERNKKISFAWGSYELNGRIWCDRPWNPQELKKHNYISTMSLVRSSNHPGFDENIKRLQDWDVWLTMMERGHTGAYIGEKIFTTPLREGITRQSIGWDEAVRTIKIKHNLN